MRYVIFRAVRVGQSVDLPVVFADEISFEHVLALGSGFMTPLSAGNVGFANSIATTANGAGTLLTRPEDARLLEQLVLGSRRPTKTRTLFDTAADMVLDVRELSDLATSVLQLLPEWQRPSFKFTLLSGNRSSGELYERLVMQYTSDDSDAEAQTLTKTVEHMFESYAKGWRARAVEQRARELAAKAEADAKAASTKTST